jgi:hypothetical protein
MTCTNNQCEYKTTLNRKPAQAITKEQQKLALAYMYYARDLCLTENREDLARQWQHEIKKHGATEYELQKAKLGKHKLGKHNQLNQTYNNKNNNNNKNVQNLPDPTRLTRPYEAYSNPISRQRATHSTLANAKYETHTSTQKPKGKPILPFIQPHLTKNCRNVLQIKNNLYKQLCYH